MKRIKQFVTLASLLAMLGTSAHNLSAEDCAVNVTDAGGYGYEQCRRVPSLAPAIALGAVALAAIIAVAVQNSSHHSHSSHLHGHSSSD